LLTLDCPPTSIAPANLKRIRGEVVATISVADSPAESEWSVQARTGDARLAKLNQTVSGCFGLIRHAPALAALSISSRREIHLRLVVCHPPHEFRAGMYFQLSVDTSQVELDCLRGDEERCGHVAVGFALGDEARDLEFLRRELIPRRGLTTAWRQTGRSELRARALRPRRRSAALEGFECSAEMRARVASVAATAEVLAEAELSSGVLERARAVERKPHLDISGISPEGERSSVDRLRADPCA
jgi:hypothetical protein